LVTKSDGGRQAPFRVTSIDSTDAPIAPISPAERAPSAVALRELFVAHAGYVGNSLRRLGIPHDDLEDVLHEVFLQVHRHLHEYDRSRPARPWLFAFAFRVAAQHRRRAHCVREVRDASVEAIDASPPADAQIAAAQDRQLILDALADLPLERRAVFVLYEIDGAQVHEIEQALAIPANTVYSRLRVARQEFAAAVKRHKLRRGDR
jgi:RNA polymerase sigma-70 factor (ECF subfamily)